MFRRLCEKGEVRDHSCCSGRDKINLAQILNLSLHEAEQQRVREAAAERQREAEGRERLRALNAAQEEVLQLHQLLEPANAFNHATIITRGNQLCAQILDLSLHEAEQQRVREAAAERQREAEGRERLRALNAAQEEVLQLHQLLEPANAFNHATIITRGNQLCAQVSAVLYATEEVSCRHVPERLYGYYERQSSRLFLGGTVH
ncbi:mRNA export factor GLE1-like [Engraulis encrasicolus]|uniref:mRNA export factor GLE1-like n=1 Tax=Engraulis encrasicolus TaxID=184585 RepID=UPI002FD16028